MRIKTKTRNLRIDIITIFPRIFESYFNESIIRRGHTKGFFDIKIHNLRDFAEGKHKKVDDRPYGGGAGMVLSAKPLLKAVRHILKNKKRSRRTKIIIFSAKGSQFTQKKAYTYSTQYNHLIFISGRYEGIDERVKVILGAEEVSVGPYVLTDGDVAAMVLVSSIARLIPGVINFKSLEEESHRNVKTEREIKITELEYPHYTRPEVVEWPSRGGKKYRVPKLLLLGDHARIKAWRQSKASKKP